MLLRMVECGGGVGDDDDGGYHDSQPNLTLFVLSGYIELLKLKSAEICPVESYFEL